LLVTCRGRSRRRLCFEARPGAGQSSEYFGGLARRRTSNDTRCLFNVTPRMPLLQAGAAQEQRCRRQHGLRGGSAMRVPQQACSAAARLQQHRQGGTAPTQGQLELVEVPGQGGAAVGPGVARGSLDLEREGAVAGASCHRVGARLVGDALVVGEGGVASGLAQRPAGVARGGRLSATAKIFHVAARTAPAAAWPGSRAHLTSSGPAQTQPPGWPPEWSRPARGPGSGSCRALLLPAWRHLPYASGAAAAPHHGCYLGLGLACTPRLLAPACPPC
jgi:hypothetical protein